MEEEKEAGGEEYKRVLGKGVRRDQSPGTPRERSSRGIDGTKQNRERQGSTGGDEEDPEVGNGNGRRELGSDGRERERETCGGERIEGKERGSPEAPAGARREAGIRDGTR